MKEEMYIPGQDDFPGWDEFYRSRPLSRERMRYSVKTLMLLPLMVAVALAMYLLGLNASKKERASLVKDLAAAQQERDTAKRASLTDTATATLERQVRDRIVQENRAAMKAVIALAIDLRVKIATISGFRDTGNQMLADLASRLKGTADTLRSATGSDFDSKVAVAENDALIWSHLDLGEALAIVGGSTDDRDADARRQFLDAQELARSIVHFHPKSTEALSNLFIAEARFGDFNWQAGRSEAARDNYRDALEAVADFDALVPKKAALSPRISVVLLASEGDAHLQSGLALSAADNYQDALAIMRDKSVANARNKEFQRDLAILFGKLGDAHLLAADPTQTQDSHQGRFNVNWTTVIRDPQLPGSMRDDYFRFTLSSDGNRRSDELTRAREAYESSLALVPNIRKLEPGAVAPEMAHALARLGCLEMAAERYATASMPLEKAISILAQLPAGAASASDESDMQDAPYVATTLVGGEAFAIACGQSDDETRNSGISAARDSASLMTAATAVAESDAQERCLKDLREKLAFCKSALLAIDDVGFIRHQQKNEIPRWLGVRGRALARAGRADGATATAELLAEVEPRRGENLLAAAEIYAILAIEQKPAAAESDVSPENDPEADPAGAQPAQATQSASDDANWFRKLQDSYAARAVKLLRDAADAGYPGDVKKPSSTLLDNSNLAALVGRDDFQSLLVGLDAADAEKAQKSK
jgi:hypothetical protein